MFFIILPDENKINQLKQDRFSPKVVILGPLENRFLEPVCDAAQMEFVALGHELFLLLSRQSEKLK